MTTDPMPAVPGEIMHALEAGIIVAGGVRRRGEEFVISQQDIDNSRGLDGTSYLDDLSPEAQERLWGRQRLAFGPWTGGVTWEQGDPEWEAERRQAVERVKYISDPDERDHAMREIRRTYGAAPENKSYVRTASPGEIAARRQQAERERTGQRAMVQSVTIPRG